MKHTDEYLKEIFSKKLGEYESNVSPELWSNIASQLPQATATITAATAAKTISAKLIWTAAVVAVSVASLVTYLVVKNDDNKAITQTTEQPAHPNIPTTTEEAIKEEIPATEEVKNIVPENKVLESNTVVVPAKSNNKTSNSAQAVNGNNSDRYSVPMRTVIPEVPKETVVSVPTTSNNTNTSSVASQAVKQNEENNRQAPTAQFSIAPVNKEELRYFFMPQFTDATSYVWDFGNGNTSSEISPMYTFDEEGIANIHLTITTKDGEQKVFTQKLSVFQPGKMEIPNIFTPNGDGQNDYFDVLEKSKNVEIQKIVVFSSDKKIFESEGDKLWDGNDTQGNPLPAGEYKYFVLGIDKEGNKIDKKGFVTLRR